MMKILLLVSLLLCGTAFAQTPRTRPLQRAQPTTPVPPDTEFHADITYAIVNRQDLLLDLYLPEDQPGPFPLIVWMHGGGWSSGSKSNCPASVMARRGYAVASIGYRLSGVSRFPAQIMDCKAAIRFLRANAERFRINPDRVAAWGASSGGHLAAMLGTTGDVRGFEVGDHLEFSSRVQAVVVFFGPTDFLQMDEHALANSPIPHNAAGSPESRLIGGPIQQNVAKVRAANPITFITPDDPPFFIAHGDKDPIVPHHQSELLYDALVEKGVSVHFHTIEGGTHGGGFSGPEINRMVMEFFDRHLKPEGPVEKTTLRTSGPAESPSRSATPSDEQ